MNPYKLTTIDLSLLCKNDIANIISWADECVSGFITHRAHYEMERSLKPIKFNDSLWNKLDEEITDSEWIYAFARHSIIYNLAKAFKLTNNEKYLTALKKLLLSFFNYSDNKGESWRSLEVGIRPENWLRSLALIDDYQLEEKIKNSLLKHKEILLNTHRGFHRLSNWGVLQDHGLFIISIYFEDFEMAKVALERLNEEALLQCEENGIHWEQSPMYQAEVLHALLDTILQARKVNIELPNNLINNTHKMANSLSQMVSNSSNIFMLGDSDEINVDDLLTLASYLFDDNELFRGIKEENIFDGLRYRDYTKKERSSYSDISSGNHIIRTTKLEAHLFAGNLGSGHGHISPLHVDISGKECPFFIDSGRFTYVDNEKRRYYKSAEAHNIPILKQGYLAHPKGSWSFDIIGETTRGCLIKKNGYEMIIAENLTYKEICIRRKVIKASPDILIIIDEFLSKKICEAEQLFHLHPNCKIKDNIIENNGEKIFIYSSANMSIKPCFISLHYNEESESRVLKFKQKLAPNGSIFTIISTKALHLKQEEIRLIDSNRVLTNSEGIAYSFDDITIISRPCEIVNQVDIISAGQIKGYGRVIIQNKNERFPTTLYF